MLKYFLNLFEMYSLTHKLLKSVFLKHLSQLFPTPCWMPLWPELRLLRNQHHHHLPPAWYDDLPGPHQPWWDVLRHLNHLGDPRWAVPGGGGKMVSRTEDNIDDTFIDENVSTEGPRVKYQNHNSHWCWYYCEPALAGNQLHKSSLQEVQQRFYGISQSQTWRKDSR